MRDDGVMEMMRMILGGTVLGNTWQVPIRYGDALRLPSLHWANGYTSG